MGNPNNHGGFYFVEYKRTDAHTLDRTKGSFRHYINYLKAGTSTYFTEQGAFTFQQGDLFYFPMNLGYTSFSEDVVLISCGFTLFPEAENHSYLPQKLPERLIPQLLAIPKEVVPGTKALAQFYALLAEVLPYLQEAPHPNDASLYNSLRIFLWRNYTCSIEDMAQHFQLSVPSLYRLLRQTANTTPNQVKQEVLIEKAKLWLTDTNYSIGQISDGLCFCNNNYFTKIFKQHTGKTPRQYRMEASALSKEPMEH